MAAGAKAARVAVDINPATRPVLTGTETFTVRGIAGGLRPGQHLEVAVRGDDGSASSFSAVCRLDSDTDVEYYRNGGILPLVLRQLRG